MMHKRQLLPSGGYSASSAIHWLTLIAALVETCANHQPAQGLSRSSLAILPGCPDAGAAPTRVTRRPKAMIGRNGGGSPHLSIKL
jgi:hypothetical protein